MNRKMDKVLMAIGAMLVLPMPAAAQAIVPIISPGQAAEGVFSRSRTDADGHRQQEETNGQVPATSPSAAASDRPEPGTPEYRKQACDNRPIYRRQYGENDPQVLKLEAICKEAGY